MSRRIWSDFRVTICRSGFGRAACLRGDFLLICCFHRQVGFRLEEGRREEKQVFG